MYPTCADFDRLAEKSFLGEDIGVPKHYNPTVEVSLPNIGWLIYVGGEDRMFSVGTNMWFKDPNHGGYFCEVSEEHKRLTPIFAPMGPGSVIKEPILVCWFEPRADSRKLHQFPMPGPAVSLWDISNAICDYYRKYDDASLPKVSIALKGFKVSYRLRTIQVLWH